MYLFEFCMFENLGSTMAWGTGEETTHRPWPSISPAQLVVFVSYPMGWRQILVNAVKHFLPLTESFPEVPSAMMNRPATSNGWCLQAVVKVFQVQKDFTFYLSQSISAAVTVYQTELHLAHGFSAGKSKDSTDVSTIFRLPHNMVESKTENWAVLILSPEAHPWDRLPVSLEAVETKIQRPTI